MKVRHQQAQRCHKPLPRKLLPLELGSSAVGVVPVGTANSGPAVVIGGAICNGPGLDECFHRTGANSSNDAEEGLVGDVGEDGGYAKYTATDPQTVLAALLSHGLAVPVGLALAGEQGHFVGSRAHQSSPFI